MSGGWWVGGHRCQPCFKTFEKFLLGRKLRRKERLIEGEVDHVLEAWNPLSKRQHLVGASDVGRDDRHRLVGTRHDLGHAILQRKKLSSFGTLPLGIDDEQSSVVENADTCSDHAGCRVGVSPLDWDVTHEAHHPSDDHDPPQLSHCHCNTISPQRTPEIDRVEDRDVVAGDHHRSCGWNVVTALHDRFGDLEKHDHAQEPPQPECHHGCEASKSAWRLVVSFV